MLGICFPSPVYGPLHFSEGASPKTDLNENAGIAARPG